MATKSQVEKALNRIGGFLEYDSSYGMATAYTPKGYIWNDNECSRFCINYGYRGAMQDVWMEMLDAVKSGYCEAPENIDDAWWI